MTVVADITPLVITSCGDCEQYLIFSYLLHKGLTQIYKKKKKRFTQILFKHSCRLTSLSTEHFITEAMGQITGIYILVIFRTSQRMAIEFLCKTLLEKANCHAASPQCNTEDWNKISHVAFVKISQGQGN